MLPYVSIIYFTLSWCRVCCGRCVPWGLPMRPGARICESFAKNGTCRVGTACRFDHPEGMKAAEPNLKTWWHGQFHQVSANIFLNHVDTAVYHGMSWNIMEYVVTCCDMLWHVVMWVGHFQLRRVSNETMGNGLPLLHVQALAGSFRSFIGFLFGGWCHQTSDDSRGRWALVTSSGIASGIIRTSASVASSTKQLASPAVQVAEISHGLGWNAATTAHGNWCSPVLPNRSSWSLLVSCSSLAEQQASK